MADTYLISNISTIRQLRNCCGPAALASVLRYWGIETSQEEIATRTFRKHAQATHGSDLLLFCRNEGLNAYSYSGSIRDLKRKVRMGLPVIVLQMTSHPCRCAHYRVVIGYDDRLASMIVLDPARSGKWHMPYPAFSRSWGRCGRWALLVTPADHRLEQADCTEHGNAVLHYDLATAYMHSGDTRSAVRHLRQAARSSARALRK